jgi:hypothetical protein
MEYERENLSFGRKCGHIVKEMGQWIYTKMSHISEEFDS